MNMYMRILTTLLKREFSEHRLLFVYTPLLCVAMAFLNLVFWLPDTEFTFPRRSLVGLSPDEVARYEELYLLLNTQWYTNVVWNGYESYLGMMQVAFWASMAYYYLYSLYQQRQNRSILFWNSLPVSDTQTIAAKLLAGLVGCHLIYVACFFVLELLMFASVWVYRNVSGIASWDYYLNSSQLLARPFEALLEMPLLIGWSLPVYAWLLLASAWPKRAPFAWAVGPVLLVVIGELTFREYSWLFDALTTHALPFHNFVEDLPNSSPRARFVGFLPSYDPLAVAVSVLCGVAFILAAIRLNRSDDT